MSDYVLHAGTTGHDVYSVDVSPERAGWTYSGLRIVELAAGESVTLTTGVAECLVLPLQGAATVTVQQFANFLRLDQPKVSKLTGRASIWGEVTDYLYVPRNAELTITAPEGGRFALPSAVADTDRPVRYCPASEVRVELRGAGNCSRQVVNYALNNAVETDRLLVCEVLTPGGNWSSYPPHKHDEESDCEHELEEIYYFEIRSDEHGPGMAFHSTYGTAERPIEVAARVASGDVALVPHGWHGPCVAAPGYDLYYLNVMAGPFGPEWKSIDDPCFGWVRSTWTTQEIDPRLPMPVKEA